MASNPFAGAFDEPVATAAPSPQNPFAGAFDETPAAKQANPFAGAFDDKSSSTPATDKAVAQTKAIVAPRQFSPEERARTGMLYEEPSSASTAPINTDLGQAPPLVSPEGLKPVLKGIVDVGTAGLPALANWIDPQSAASKAYQGAVGAGADIGSSLTTPTNLALMTVGGPVIKALGKMGTVLLSSAFEAQALHQSPQQWKEFKEAYNAGDVEKATRLGADLVAGVTLPAAAVAIHGAMGEAKPVPETLKSSVEAPLAKPETPTPPAQNTGQEQAAAQLDKHYDDLAVSIVENSKPSELKNQVIEQLVMDGVSENSAISQVGNWPNDTMLNFLTGKWKEYWKNNPEDFAREYEDHFDKAPAAQPQIQEPLPANTESVSSAEAQNKGGGQPEKVQEEPVPQGQEKKEVLSGAGGATPPAPEPMGGVSAKAFERVYGPGEIQGGEGRSPEEMFQSAQARHASGQADPYGIAEKAKTGAITPDQFADLVVEHDRLVNEAAAKEGTPEYEPAYQASRDFAQNVLGPAKTRVSDTMRAMQIQAPIDYTKLTGFRRALNERIGREMTPEEAPAFKKVADDITRSKNDAQAAAVNAANKVNKRYAGVRDIPFEDAFKQLHDSIEEAVKGCVL